MNSRFRTLAIMVTGATLTAWLAAGCYPYGGDPGVYGSVSVSGHYGGYYGGYGRGYYGPVYGRPYPPYGSRPPSMRPPSSRPPRPMNPIERPPRPGRMPSMGGGRMPSIPSRPRPGRF